MAAVSPLRVHIRSVPENSWLTLNDLATQYGSRDAISATLRRARDAGEVVGLHRGIYWKGRQTRYGMTRPDTVAVGLAVARYAGFASGVGPAGWTASNMLGLSTQIPRRCHLAIPGLAPSPPRHVEFHARPQGGRTGLNFIEVAVLEVLLAWPYEIEADWSAVTKKAHQLAAAGKVDLLKIARTARMEGDPVVCDRAEALVNRQGLAAPVGKRQQPSSVTACVVSADA